MTVKSVHKGTTQDGTALEPSLHTNVGNSPFDKFDGPNSMFTTEAKAKLRLELFLVENNRPVIMILSIPSLVRNLPDLECTSMVYLS